MNTPSARSSLRSALTRRAYISPRGAHGLDEPGEPIGVGSVRPLTPQHISDFQPGGQEVGGWPWTEMAQGRRHLPRPRRDRWMDAEARGDQLAHGARADDLHDARRGAGLEERIDRERSGSADDGGFRV